MAKQIILPHLETWQKDVFDAMDGSRGSRKRFVVVARRQCGKSILAIVELIKVSLEHKGTSVLVEPTRSQCVRVLKQLVGMLDGSGVIKQCNETTLTITFVNGSEILFKSAEQRDNLRGFTCTNLLVIDEAAFITDDIFYILYPTSDANGCPILIISTPLFCEGEFYNLFTTENELVKTFNWGNYDTSKYLPKETLEMYRKTLSEQKFKSEYLGEFITDGGYVFGNIQPCIKETNDEPIYGGIDWGTGQNGDSTVIILFNALGNVVYTEDFNNISPVEQINKISSILNRFSTLKKVQVELNSIGQVYYDYLRRAVNSNIEIVGFTTSNESKRRIIEKLITAFNKEEITIPNNSSLIKQLQHYAMEKTSKGYTYNGIGEHDDYVMALAIGYDVIVNSTGVYNLGNYKRITKLSLREKYG